MSRVPAMFRFVLVAAASVGVAWMSSPGAASSPTHRLRATGGPDTFGHTFIDSAETGGPDYATEVEDITASGTAITFAQYATWSAADEGEFEAPIGFTFSFYGANYTTVWVNTNGFLKFGSSTVSGSNGQSAFSATTLPDPQQPGIVAVRWTDWLNTSAWYTTLGTAPDRRLVVYWTDGNRTCEAKLYENGEIVTVYIAGGADGTQGIQNLAGDDGLLYGYNGSPNAISDGLAIRFVPPQPAPPDPTGLAQFLADGTTPLATGGSTSGTTVVVSGTVTNPGSVNRRMQVEVRPTSQGFTGTFTHEGTDSTSAALSVAVSGLSVASYHWRARVFETGTGLASNWVAFGGNDSGGDPTDQNGATDFAVTAPSAPPPSPPPSGGGSHHKSRCGNGVTEGGRGVTGLWLGVTALMVLAAGMRAFRK